MFGRQSLKLLLLQHFGVSSWGPTSAMENDSLVLRNNRDLQWLAQLAGHWGHKSWDPKWYQQYWNHIATKMEQSMEKWHTKQKL